MTLRWVRNPANGPEGRRKVPEHGAFLVGDDSEVVVEVRYVCGAWDVVVYDIFDIPTATFISRHVEFKDAVHVAEVEALGTDFDIVEPYRFDDQEDSK